jgi:AcrR family transcriptional regulator
MLQIRYIELHKNELSMTTTGTAQTKLKNRKPGRPRKSPSSEGKSRDVKLDILDAAVSLIAKHGFDGFVLRDIASAVGVHTALVGYYFKTKQQLEKAALDRQIEQFERLFPNILSADDLAPRDALKSIFVELARMYRQDEPGHRFKRWTFAKGGQYAEELFARLCTPTMNQISKHIQKLMPEINSAEASARALLLITLAENCAELKFDRMSYLKGDCAPEILFDCFYQVIERQFIPEVSNFCEKYGDLKAESTTTS